MCSEKPLFDPFGVNSVVGFPLRGPWTTKSNGNLSVLLALPYNEFIAKFFEYDGSELRRLKTDIRGFRSYQITDLKKGNIGGTEFHRIRNEVLFVLEGRFDVICEDVFGGKKNFSLMDGGGIYIPSFILHTYKVLSDGRLFVMANTLFDPNDLETHDTYSLDLFRQLQSKY
jgi:mannose-6-phosphate isomerase-like protein (cupin superfamily)